MQFCLGYGVLRKRFVEYAREHSQHLDIRALLEVSEQIRDQLSGKWIGSPLDSARQRAPMLAYIIRNIDSTIGATVAAISFDGIFGDDQDRLTAMSLVENFQRNLVV